MAWDQPKITDAPVVLIVLGDREGLKKGNAGFEKDFAESVKAGIMKQEQYDWFVNAPTLFTEYRLKGNWLLPARTPDFSPCR